MTEQKSLLDRIKPGKVTRQEYAERPFDFYTLKQSGGEVTIEESINWETDKPRVVKIKGFKDPNETFEKIAIKVTDGIFTKDLHLSEGEYTKLMAAFPSTLTNLRGVTFKLSRGQAFDTKIEYLRVERQDMDGNAYNNPHEPASTDIGNQIRALHAAMQANQAVRIFNSKKTTLDIAEKTRPGDAQNLIDAARREGWIRDITEGGVSGYRAD